MNKKIEDMSISELADLFVVVDNTAKVDGLPTLFFKPGIGKLVETAYGNKMLAIRLSIAKWMRIVEITSDPNIDIHDGGPQTCALCLNYRAIRKVEEEQGYCLGCPVREKSGHEACYGTPYEHWAHTRDRKDALDELAFLIDVLADQIKVEPQKEKEYQRPPEPENPEQKVPKRDVNYIVWTHDGNVYIDIETKEITSSHSLTEDMVENIINSVSPPDSAWKRQAMGARKTQYKIKIPSQYNPSYFKGVIESRLCVQFGNIVRGY